MKGKIPEEKYNYFMFLIHVWRYKQIAGETERCGQQRTQRA